MSRIGRLPIDVPAGVTVTIEGQNVAVKGPKGELSLTVKEPIEAKLVENQVIVTRPDDERESRSLHGLTRTLIRNQIVGVTEGYQKSLQVVGTGYRVASKVPLKVLFLIPLRFQLLLVLYHPLWQHKNLWYLNLCQ